jgi:hypothetical protein
MSSICFLSGFRFKFVLETNVMDFTHDGEIAGIPGELELYLGIMGACLPMISPPLLAISQKVQSGYSSILARRRSGYNESGSDADSLPQQKSGSQGQLDAWEEMALKSWPDSAKDCVVEVNPMRGTAGAEIDEHTIQCHSEWIVKSETRSDV